MRRTVLKVETRPGEDSGSTCLGHTGSVDVNKSFSYRVNSESWLPLGFKLQGVYLYEIRHYCKPWDDGFALWPFHPLGREKDETGGGLMTPKVTTPSLVPETQKIVCVCHRVVTDYFPCIKSEKHEGNEIL